MQKATDAMPDRRQDAGLQSRGLSASWWMVALAFAILYVPTGIDLYRVFWSTDEQGHGPIIVGLAAWLIWRRRGLVANLPGPAENLAGGAALAVGLLLYVIGRSQAIVQFEAGSAIVFVFALTLLWRGWGAARLLWFPMFFLLFAIPLPGVFVQTITVPLKSGVSWVAEHVLYALGFPVARAGVILQVGQYQLLVADACAGLNSMFTLESLGLLYMNVMEYQSRLRNTLLALLVIPISFVANVIRVMILVLVTYYFGDEAGQGFVHGAAGMVLFVVALLLLLAVDRGLSRWMPESRRA